jgi:hypothetical protein
MIRTRYVLLALALFCAKAGAASSSSPGAGCANFDLPSRQEHLSQVLRELSAVRAFRLENWSDEDPVVTTAGGNDVQLMATLAGQVNLMVRYAPAKGCPGQWKVDTVWILPGKAQSSAQNIAPPAAPASAPAGPTPAEAAATKAATDMYLRAHGLPSSGATAKQGN